MADTIEFTKEQLKQIIPSNEYIDKWYDALMQYLPVYEINTPQRIAGFLAQCAHESGEFTKLVENLNYGAQGLANTWPTRFAVKGADGKPVKPYVPTSLATSLQRNPELIANNIYANRLGNGDEASGDGWHYRGQGLIQLTGKSNQQAFADAVGTAVEDISSYLATFEGAVQSACWFWSTHNLNQYADIGDIEAMTKKINGGLVGIDDRTARYQKAVNILVV